MNDHVKYKKGKEKEEYYGTVKKFYHPGRQNSMNSMDITCVVEVASISALSSQEDHIPVSSGLTKVSNDEWNRHKEKQVENQPKKLEIVKPVQTVLQVRKLHYIRNHN